MFHLEITEYFSAAHALRNYPGVCARIHGHNWKVRVGLSCQNTNSDGMTADYGDLKKIIADCLSQFDHSLINDHPYFQKINPTSEEIAQFFYSDLVKKIPDHLRLEFVQVAETDGFAVTYR